MSRRTKIEAPVAPVGELARGIWSASSGDPLGRLIVLVHGSMDRSAGLSRLSRRLQQKFRVVRYDRRGYGRSTNSEPPSGVAGHVDDLADVVSAAAGENAGALLFGHSFGGNVALALADKQPRLVSAVAVYEAPLAWNDWWPGNSAGGAAMSAVDPGDAAEAFMRRLVGDSAWNRLSASKRAARRAEGVPMVAELADLRRRAPWLPERINVPVLAQYGELSKPHHHRAMSDLSDLLAGGRSEMISEAGHGGPHSHSDRVAARLIEFFD